MGDIYLADFQTGQLVNMNVNGFDLSPYFGGMTIGPDKTTIYYTDNDLLQVLSFDTTTGEKKTITQGTAFQLSPSGDRMLVYGADGATSLYSFETQTSQEIAKGVHGFFWLNDQTILYRDGEPEPHFVDVSLFN